MKKIILTAAAVFALSFANAQDKKGTSEGFAKGDVFISGTVGFGSEKSGEMKGSNFTFSPKLGYFVADNLALGLAIGIGNSTKDVMDVNGGSSVSASNKSTSFGAFGRYYMKTGKFAPFAELNVNFGNDKMGYTNYAGMDVAYPAPVDGKTMSINFVPGFNYFVSDSFALETSIGVLGYSSGSFTSPVENADGSFDTIKSTKTQIGLNLASINFGASYKF
ncbi:hypothetical protein [Flavobacterium sp.]|uniref:hypothetical protein n=1 Tax=Flavobacterium sp. TaxID=239 RepID=UPI003BEC6AD9